ncbi:hypothetical protein SARC_09260, partial [Sphaeroforma arctica JP610]
RNLCTYSSTQYGYYRLETKCPCRRRLYHQFMKEGMHITKLQPMTEGKYCITDASFLIYIAILRCIRSYCAAPEIAHSLDSQGGEGVTDTLSDAIVAVFKSYSDQCTQEFGCTPVFVFDGRVAPSRYTEHGRRVEDCENAFRIRKYRQGNRRPWKSNS